jgi:nitronate monooxygenase
MKHSESLLENLNLPVIAAPMFLISGPELVINCCKNGVIGTFPALNQRSSEGFEEWLIQIKDELRAFEEETGKKAAPFGVNLIVHPSNPRIDSDLQLCIKHKVPLIITSLGAIGPLVDQIHAYGGKVFHDIVKKRHAEKAAEAGVDGLILVSAGAGGHGGTINPFALINEIRAFFDKTIVLAGCLSTGQDIAAALQMGADAVYMGTRFINTKESMAEEAYKEMIQSAKADDIRYTKAVSGVLANFLSESLANAGLTEEDLKKDKKVDLEHLNSEAKAWKNVWSAGQGVTSIKNNPSTATLIDELKSQFKSSLSSHIEESKKYL